MSSAYASVLMEIEIWNSLRYKLNKGKCRSLRSASVRGPISLLLTTKNICFTLIRLSMNFLTRAEIPISLSLCMSKLDITLSKALFISKKAQTVTEFLTNLLWISLNIITKQSIHALFDLKPNCVFSSTFLDSTNHQRRKYIIFSIIFLVSKELVIWDEFPCCSTWGLALSTIVSIAVEKHLLYAIINV